MLNDKSPRLDLSQVGETNYVHSAQEQKHIRECLLNAKRDLQHADDEIARFELEKITLNDKITRYQTAISPIKNVPPEAMHVIFDFFIEEAMTVPVDVEDPRLILGRVCSQWRQIVQNTPGFWTDIHLTIGATNARTIQIARECLNRGKNLPRDFVVVIQKNIPEYDAWGLHVVSNLVAHYPLRALELSLNFEQLRMFSMLSNELLLPLEYLYLTCLDREEILEWPLLFPSSVQLPELESVALYGYWDPEYFPSTTIPWKQLHLLHLEAPVSSSFSLKMLRQCPSLHSCKLVIGSEQEDMTNAKQDDVLLCHLETLELMFVNGLPARQVVSLLTLPSVRSLSLLGDEDVHLGCDSLALSQMIQRSNGMPCLKSLCISETEAFIDLGLLLLGAPSIEVLDITNGALDNEATVGISLGSLGPKLKEITTKHSHDVSKILPMLELRHQNVDISPPNGSQNRAPRLETVSFTFQTVNDRQKSTYPARIKALQEAGMIIDTSFLW